MTHRIVVLGAGYAGLVAAQRLCRRLRGTPVEVTLVSASERFVERVRLHQVATGQRLPDLPLRRLAGCARLVVDTVTAIDAGARTVRLTGTVLPYDTLVYALGSGADTTTVLGVAEHADTVASYPEAVRLAAALSTSAGAVTVVGGGLTGIETAAEVATAYPGRAVELVTGGVVGAGVGERGRRYLRTRLAGLGVTVHEGLRVDAVTEEGISTGGALRRARVVVWTAGFRVPPIAAVAGLAVDAGGRIVVDEWLRSVSHPEVYAVGDAAAVRIRGAAGRMCCQTAIPMGVHVARIVAARLAGRSPRPARLRYVWQNISLGRRDALTQFVRADDRPMKAVLTGRVAAGFKEAVTRGTVTMVR